MADDAGTTIGKVSIKVHPDSKEFRGDLKDDLEKIEKSVKMVIAAQVGQRELERSTRAAILEVNRQSSARKVGMFLKLRAEIDDKDLDRRIRKIVREVNRELGTVNDIEVDADTEPAKSAIGELTDAIENRVQHMSRAVTNDSQQMLDDVGRAVQRMHAELESAGREKHNLAMRIMIDEDARRQAMEDLDDFHSEYDGMDIGFVVDLAAIAYRSTQVRLAALARTRYVHLVPLVDNKAYKAAEAALAALSGARLIASTLRNVADLFKNLDKSLPLIGSIALAVAGLSSWLLASASNTFALSRGLAQIGGAGLLLPGLLTGIGLGIGTMVVALGDFNQRIPEAGRALSYLKTMMQDAFWTTALEPMREAIHTLLPEFANGFIATGGVMGIFFRNLSNSARTHLGGEVAPMFRQLQASVLIASAGTDDWMRSVEVLGRVGSSYLPRFAAWMNDIGAGLRGWLDEAERTGRLNDIIETGILRMREFGEVIKWTGSILASLGRAAEAAGGSTLKSLGDELERIAAFMKGESFQSGFIQILDAAHGAMDRIVKISGPAFNGFWTDFADTVSSVLRVAGDAIGELFRGIGEALNQPALTTGVESFFSGLAEGVRGMAPMWSELGDAIGTVGQLLGTTAAAFGPVLGKLLEHVSRLAVEIGPELERMVVSLSGLMETLLTVAGPALIMLVDNFAQLAAAVAENHVLVGLLVAAFATIKLGIAWTALVGQFDKLKLAIKGTTDVTGKAVGGIGKLAVKLGAVGAALAAAAGIGQWASQVGVTAKGTDKWAVALKKVANSGGPEAVAELNAAFTGSKSGWDSWVKPFKDTGDNIKTLATDVTSLSDAIGYVDGWANSNPFEKLFGANDSTAGLFGHSAALNQSKVALEEFDAAMAQIVASGNADEIAAVQQYLAEQIKASGLSTSEVMALLPEYGLQLENTKLEQQLLAEEVRSTDSAMLAYNGALEAAYGPQFAMRDAVNEASKAFIDFSTDIGNAELSLDGWITKLEEQAVAQASWADNMAWLMANASADLVAEFTTLGVEGAARLQQLRDEGGASIGRLEEIIKLKTSGARENAGTEFAKMEGELIAELNKLPPATIKKLEELGLVMTAQGGNVITGLANGMTDANDEVEAASNGAADTVKDALKNGLEIRSPSRVAHRFGGFVSQGLAQGILSGTSMVITAAATIAGAIQIPNPGTLLKAAGSLVISGFISGISAGFSAVKRTLSSLTALLPDWKGPASRDQVILREAGQLVIEGFVDGLRDRFGDVRDVLGELTDEVERTEIGGPQFDPTELGRVSRAAGARFAGAASYESNKTFIYNAAPGSSLDSEEELFSALNRGRGAF